MSIRFDSHWQYHNLRALVLENPTVRLIVLPETGARIFSIVHKPSDTEFLWHHPRNQPRVIPYGSNFDDTWPGGWDEILPSTEPSVYRGDRLPSMGELWALPWEWRDDGAAGIYTGVSAAILPLRFERWIMLDATRPFFHLRYRLTNLGLEPLDLNWGIHPVFAITPQHRIDLPSCTGIVEQSNGDKLGQPGMIYQWPHLSTGADMSHVLPFETNVFGGHYATELGDGWLALTDTARRIGIGMCFPQNIFSALWVWQVYGGWRGLYQLAIEPWVGYPVHWEEALAAGRTRRLMPGVPLEYTTTMTIYSGLERVTGIHERDGVVDVEGI
jgi:galactose mutarotase-like enzyme